MAEGTQTTANGNVEYWRTDFTASDTKGSFTIGRLKAGTYLLDSSSYGDIIFGPAGGGFFLKEDTDITATIPDTASSDAKGVVICYVLPAAEV